MANKIRAVTWILENSEKLEISIKKLTWIEELLPGWTDVFCTFRKDKKILCGRGAAQDEDLALCKAFAEALERGALYDSDYMISSGFAAHTSVDAVERNARHELVERDHFLCHFLTGTPFQIIHPFQNDAKLTDSIQRWTNKHKIILRFFRLAENGVLCLINGPGAITPFGMSSGTAIRETFFEAAISALIEASRTAAAFLSDPESAITIAEFNQLDKYNFHDHGRLALNLEYASNLAALFPHTSIDPKLLLHEHPSINTSEIKVERINWKPFAENYCPFVFARASSKFAQNLWLGPTTPEVINLDRLRAFSGKPIAWENLNLLPHPFD